MHKKVIIGGVIAVIAIVAVSIFALTGGDDSKSQQTKTKGSSADPASTSANEFEAIATKDQSFQAVMTGTRDTTTYTANLEYDGKGNSRYSGTSGGTTFEAFMLGSRYVICSNGTCFEMSQANSPVPVSEDQYSYSDDNLANFRRNATYKGKQDCPAGTCNAWDVKTTDFTGTIFVDDEDRISKVSSKSDKSAFDITYTYQPVTITPPANIQTLPTTP